MVAYCVCCALCAADDANEEVFNRSGARIVPFDSFYNKVVSNEISLRDDFMRWAARK